MMHQLKHMLIFNNKPSIESNQKILRKMNEPCILIKNHTINRSESDKLLANGWVTDRVILFRYSLLEERINTESNTDNVIFMIPVLSLKIILFRNGVSLSPFPVFEKDVVFLPLTEMKKFGDCGQHWFLVVWRTNRSNEKLNTFYIMDSFNRKSEIIRDLVSVIAERFDVKNYNVEFIETSMQENSFDCGLFLIGFMEYLAEHMWDFDGLRSQVTQSHITPMRAEIAHQILQKINEQQETSNSNGMQ